jgi:hypothetical protein
MRRVCSAIAGVAVAGTVLVWCVFPVATAQEKPARPAVVKWEYKVLSTAGGGNADSKKIEEEIAKLADEGWELTHVTGGVPYVTSSSNEVAGPGRRVNNMVSFTPLLH